LLYFAWKIVRQLRTTSYFPIALSIWWYAFVLLVPLSYNGMAPYQNYVMNAYLWLLVGILFRLPVLAREERRPADSSAFAHVPPSAAYVGLV
jgi:hypothetical protein